MVNRATVEWLYVVTDVETDFDASRHDLRICSAASGG
jgi:hypothetical protein